MNTRLRDGEALIIVGPQGSGKTTLARTIAAKYGRSAEIDVTVLLSPFALNDVLHARPCTLIVDGFPHGDRGREKLKSLITSPTLNLRAKGEKRSISVRTPRLIFCINPQEFTLPATGLHYRVVTLPLPH